MSKKFVIVRGLVGLLDPLTIDCISYLNKELEWINGPSFLCKYTIVYCLLMPINIETTLNLIRHIVCLSAVLG